MEKLFAKGDPIFLGEVAKKPKIRDKGIVDINLALLMDIHTLDNKMCTVSEDMSYGRVKSMTRSSES